MAGNIVLALTRYAGMGASSRVRMIQYFPHLARLGLDVRLMPFLSDAYVDSLYQGRRPDLGDVAHSYWRRTTDLLHGARDVTFWVEKELLPFMPFLVERQFLRRAARLVVDCHDAVWLRYRDHPNVVLRCLLRDKIERLFARADVVTAGNTWIAGHARAAWARDVRVLPSVVDLERYAVRSGPRADGPWRIGWIGSPATVHYLRALIPVLRVLAARHPIDLVCIGGGMIPLQDVMVVSRDWDIATEADEIRRFDIGVMPLFDGEWERGKCGYKLIQYMACGVPVVGSRVGANPEIITDGVDGLLAGGNAEWVAVLESLMQNPEQGLRLAAAGRRKAEQLFSVQARCAELAAALQGGS